MKRGRSWSFIAVLFAVLFISTVSAHAGLTWTDYTYCASGAGWCSQSGVNGGGSVYGDVWFPDDMHPNGGFWQNQPVGGFSTESTYDFIRVFSGASAGFTVPAQGSFEGYFTVADPFIQLTYNYDYTENTGSGGHGEYGISIFDYDGYGYYEPFSNYSQIINSTSSGSNTIFIPVPVGHQMKVVVSSGNNSNGSSDSISFNYSLASATSATPVATEPISSILFVTGGTLLAGRRFIRRKA